MNTNKHKFNHGPFYRQAKNFPFSEICQELLNDLNDSCTNQFSFESFKGNLLQYLITLNIFIIKGYSCL
jgi:hypothetical protein